MDVDSIVRAIPGTNNCTYDAEWKDCDCKKYFN